MSRYALHPEAFTDIDEIWEYIAEDNIDAAEGVVDDIFAALRTLVAAPHIGHRRPPREASMITSPSTLYRAMSTMG